MLQREIGASVGVSITGQAFHSLQKISKVSSMLLEICLYFKDFSPSLWDWDADGVCGTAARMEQLCVHALLVQLYASELVSEGGVPPPPGTKALAAVPPWAAARQKTPCGGRCGWGRITSSNARPAVPSGASGAPSRPSPDPWRGRWSGWSRWWGEGGLALSRGCLLGLQEYIPTTSPDSKQSRAFTFRILSECYRSKL